MGVALAGRRVDSFVSKEDSLKAVHSCNYLIKGACFCPLKIADKQAVLFKVLAHSHTLSLFIGNRQDYINAMRFQLPFTLYA